MHTDASDRATNRAPGMRARLESQRLRARGILVWLHRRTPPEILAHLRSEDGRLSAAIEAHKPR